MRFDVHVPYVAKVKRLDVRSSMQAGTVKAVVPVDVRETEADEAPISARFETLDGMVTVRSIAGSSSVRLARPAKFRDDAAWLVDAGAQITSYYRSHRLGRQMAVATSPAEDDPRMVVRPGLDDRNEAVGKALAAVAKMTLVDGELWEATHDPVLTVVVEGVGGRATARVKACVPSATETDFLNSFRLDEADLIAPYLEAAYPGLVLPFTLPYVDVVDARALQSRPQLAALRWAGLVVASYVKHTLADAPLETLRRYARVRDLAAGRPDPSPSSAAPGGDALREALAEAYETISPHEAIHGRVTRAMAGWDVLAEREARLERDEEVPMDFAF